jgi:hypothetical protein
MAVVKLRRSPSRHGRCCFGYPLYPESGQDLTEKNPSKNKIFFFKITLFYGILLIFVGTQATKK